MQTTFFTLLSKLVLTICKIQASTVYDIQKFLIEKLKGQKNYNITEDQSPIVKTFLV